MKYSIRFILLLFLVLHGREAVAISRADSLQGLLQNTAIDTVKARILNDLAWEIRFTEPVRAVKLADEAIVLSARYRLYREMARSFRAKAFAVISENGFLKSVNYYDSAIYYAGKSGDRHLEARCINNKAGVYGDLGDFDQAIGIYSTGLDLALKLRDPQLLGVFYNNLADAYQNTGRNTRLVQDYYRKAIQYSLQSGNKASAALHSANLAKEYSSQGQMIPAAEELKRTAVLLMGSAYGTHVYASALREMASAMMDLGEYEEAMQRANVSYRILDSLRMPINSLRPLEVLTDVSVRMKRLDQAGDYAGKMLDMALKTRSKVYIKEAYKFLAAIAKSKGEYKLATEYLENYKSWSDSVFKTEREKSISLMELGSALARQEMELKYQTKLRQQENDDLKKFNRTLVIAVTGTILTIVLLVILGVLLIRTNRRSEAMNRELMQKNELVEQHMHQRELLIHEIHHRVKNNLTMLQGMFHLQSGMVEDEYMKQTFRETQTRLMSMALVHQHLYENNHHGTLDLVQFARSLVHDISDAMVDKDIRHMKFTVTGDDIELGVKLAIPLGLILNELITNSLKYAFLNQSDGEICIVMVQKGSVVEITYGDSGPGFSDTDSPKTGFGYKLLQLLTKQIKADWIIAGENGKTRHIFRLPV